MKKENNNLKIKFSLKDALFNKNKLEKIANEIKIVYKDFDKDNFIKDNLKDFPKLELKARIICIREKLYKYLVLENKNKKINDNINESDKIKTAINILLKSLPAELDTNKTDDDFGDYIYAPYNDFVAHYGLQINDIDFSLNALKEMTKRFSAEDAIRYFLNYDKEKTLKTLLKWSLDKNYHVRRLASEGTRPSLPWSLKININYKYTENILDNLYKDKTRYVVRSVANHLNDISKIDDNFVINKLKAWKKENKQNTEEMNYIIKHSLRTLIKNGNKKAFTMLNIKNNIKYKINNWKIKNKKIKVGESLVFDLDILAEENGKMIIDYIIYFQNKKGEMKSKKVHKLKSLEIIKNQNYSLHKSHKLRADMTTRKLYKGEHKIELQINGEIIKGEFFEII